MTYTWRTSLKYRLLVAIPIVAILYSLFGRPADAQALWHGCPIIYGSGGGYWPPNIVLRTPTCAAPIYACRTQGARYNRDFTLTATCAPDRVFAAGFQYP